MGKSEPEPSYSPYCNPSTLTGGIVRRTVWALVTILPYFFGAKKQSSTIATFNGQTLKLSYKHGELVKRATELGLDIICIQVITVIYYEAVGLLINVAKTKYSLFSQVRATCGEAFKNGR